METDLLETVKKEMNLEYLCFNRFSCKRQNGSQPFSVNISIIQDYSCVEAAENDRFTFDLKITMFEAIISSDINLKNVKIFFMESFLQIPCRDHKGTDR